MAFLHLLRKSVYKPYERVASSHIKNVEFSMRFQYTVGLVYDQIRVEKVMKGIGADNMVKKVAAKREHLGVCPAEVDILAFRRVCFCSIYHFDERSMP
jgi:hypothetical protein